MPAWVALGVVLLGLALRTEPAVRLRWWLGSQIPRRGQSPRRLTYRRWALINLAVGLVASALGGMERLIVLSVFVGLALLTVDFPLVLYVGVAAVGMRADGSSPGHIGMGLLLYLLARLLVNLWWVPKGHVRQAYWLSYYLTDYWTMARRPAAVLTALRAWQHSSRSIPELDWLGRRLTADQELNATLLLAAGLLQAARGDIEAARQGLQSVTDLAPGYRQGAPRRLAALWLCGEAAGRGAWGEVQDHARAGRTLLSPSLALYGKVAEALMSRPASAHGGLGYRWGLRLLSWFSHAGLRPLLDLAGEPRSRPETVSEVSAEAGPALPTALACHVSLLGQRTVAPDRLLELGLAWDQAALVVETSPLLEAAGTEERQGLVSDWRSTVVTELARLLRDGGVCITDLGRSTGMLAQARRRVREDVLRELEERHEAIYRRKEEKQALAPLDEWGEWTQARLAYERAVGHVGRDTMPLVWPLWHARFCNYAVWLFNDRRERMLAHHIFSWLLDEARFMNDAKAITLETKNARVTRAILR